MPFPLPRHERMTCETNGSLVVSGIDEASMCRLGETLALALKAGDMVWLSGDLGAGKTALARACIRAASDDAALDVPSPTFSLVQPYDHAHFGSLIHADLYRLDEGADVSDLGLAEALDDGAVLVEWPKRAAHGLPEATLDMTIDIVDETKRTVTITGPGSERIARSLAIRAFLDGNARTDATRTHLTGDASARSYETVAEAGQTRILMNAPAAPDGPPVAPYAVPYSQVAHLAEDIRPFVAVARALTGAGFVAPAIEAMDLDAGLLLIGDLGDGQIIDAERKPITERYEAAVDCLNALHTRNWPDRMPVAEGEPDHVVPRYSARAMLAEVSLLAAWYAPHRLGRALSAGELARFETLWSDLVDTLEGSEQSLVLRDYHSPNIIWQDGAAGTDRVGLIDFQDAVIGPCAYDLASLAQDARVDVPEALETRLLDRYCATRLARGAAFDEMAFRASYAVMAAQRATKIAGIFVRLSQRDGKHGYLRHLPRMEAYLDRSLRHPALDAYAAWWREVFERMSVRQAMVLAAGLGTRMRPLTDTCPKPLIEVAGRTLLDRTLDTLEAGGVERIAVNAHYMADRIDAHLAARPSPDIVVSDERAALLDSGGGVKKALPLLSDEALIVANSDTFWRDRTEDTVRQLSRSWNPDEMDMLLLLVPHADAVGFDGAGDFFRADDGRLTRRGTAGTAPLIYAGALVTTPAFVGAVPDAAFSLNRLFDQAAAAGRLFGHVLDGLWLHVGTPGAIAEAEAALAAFEGQRG